MAEEKKTEQATEQNTDEDIIAQINKVREMLGRTTEQINGGMPKGTAKPEIVIRGKKYTLRFNLNAVEQLQEEFGSMAQMYKGMRGEDGVNMGTTLATAFRIMANCDRAFHGQTENVTGDEVKHVYVGPLSRAINAAIAIGMKAETAFGNEADDEVHDAYEEEYNEKNV